MHGVGRPRFVNCPDQMHMFATDNLSFTAIFIKPVAINFVPAENLSGHISVPFEFCPLL